MELDHNTDLHFVAVDVFGIVIHGVEQRAQYTVSVLFIAEQSAHLLPLRLLLWLSFVDGSREQCADDSENAVLGRRGEQFELTQHIASVTTSAPT